MFSSVEKLIVALELQIKQGEDEIGLRKDMDQKTCVKSVLNLSTTATTAEVYTNSH